MAQKFLIALAVVAVHAFLILAIFKGCSDDAATETPAEQAAPAETALSQESPPSPSPAAGLAFAPYSDAYFTDRQQALPAKVAAMTEKCTGGIAIDLSSRSILWAKRPLDMQPMASMTKMMTAFLAVKEIKESQGTMSLNTVVPVTRTAAAVGGRQVWLDPRETFTIDELLKCILIRSANDCAYLLGEFLGNGSEAAFVTRMNEQAALLGCRRLLFHNTHGLPSAKGECMGAPQELAYLAGILMDVPEVVKWTSVTREYIRENTNKKFFLDTTNTLLKTCQGVNGMKTGMTDKAGYCIAATCERNSRRVVVVLCGCPDKAARDNLGKALIEWVYTL
ncbi:MAG TPA: serine hydrolase [Lentisphaeria bacterium]|nr:MAG: D-alanyl-D-alanine carboxypeptidase DacF precursor [Lentisphaerae bacterium ADurb.Bin082]HQC53083.1 serine hydrolase [Lentisphaeria bacterium]HQL88671.1 serine hydrolase [Lentisphaeria bacterium]